MIKRIEEGVYHIVDSTVTLYFTDEGPGGWYLEDLKNGRVSQLYEFSFEALDSYRDGTVRWENI
jgi:hypothetical protein